MTFGRNSRPRRRDGGVLSPLTLFTAFLLGFGPGSALGDSSDGNSENDHGPSDGFVAATFSTSFANITQGRTLNLSWSHIDPKYEPLSMVARLINRTSDTHANELSVTIAARIYNTSTWAWPMVPFPLPYISNGLYELQIIPAIVNLSADATSLSKPVLARSSFFNITEQDGGQQAGGSGASTSTSPDGLTTIPTSDKPGQLIANTDHTPAGPNRVALALGLSIGLASALALTAVLIFLRKRHRRQALEEEKWRRRRFAYIIE